MKANRTTHTARACEAPTGSAILPLIAGSSFHDAFGVVPQGPPATALGHFLRAAAHTPGWVNGLMALRNRAAALVGLKNLGALGGIDPAKPEHAYRPGDRVGIFTLLSNTPGEVLLCDRDKHLEVTLSVHCGPHGGAGQLVTVSTVVHVHNLLGRLYMLPVAPVHKLIVPAMLDRLAA